MPSRPVDKRASAAGVVAPSDESSIGAAVEVDDVGGEDGEDGVQSS
jgi:hypothetical protein